MADVLSFEGVGIEYRRRRGAPLPILSDVSFTVPAGGAFGLVGESGCGKSTAALAAMRYLPSGMVISAGRIAFDGRDIATLAPGELRRLRGNRIAMVYQDPMSSLNPVMTIGAQLMEVPFLHGETSRQVARERARAILAEVRIADTEAVLGRYPHQLSGGQQQRVVIAMALMAEPALLILDEPTTGLDVTIEAAILDLVGDLRSRRGAAILFISHNLGTVARICDDIGVLYAGRLVERGPIRRVFKSPAHPYTRGLFAALPGRDGTGARRPLRPIEGVVSTADRARPGCAFAARCTSYLAPECDQPAMALAPVAGDPGHRARCVRQHLLAQEYAETAPARIPPEAVAAMPPILSARGLTKVFRSEGLFARAARPIKAATDVDLDVRTGQTLAIVGESGSGKSTIARVLAGLIPGTSGEAPLGGVNLATTPVDARPWELRRRVQMVFQNPDSTLNPSHTVGYALSRPLRRLKGLSRSEARERVAELMARVRLPGELARRLPHQLSGGQRQRVAIARALAGDPEILIADEPVSALDVSVQAAIVNLLAGLLEKSDLGLVIISHDIALVRHMADWIAVMYLGRVVEWGSAAEVLGGPNHPYTAALLAAAPEPDPDAGAPHVVLGGAMPSPTAEIAGCPFASRCHRRIGAICETTPPPIRREGEHRIACHIERADLALASPAG